MNLFVTLLITLSVDYLGEKKMDKIPAQMLKPQIGAFDAVTLIIGFFPLVFRTF